MASNMELVAVSNVYIHEATNRIQSESRANFRQNLVNSVNNRNQLLLFVFASLIVIISQSANLTVASKDKANLILHSNLNKINKTLTSSTIVDNSDQISSASRVQNRQIEKRQTTVSATTSTSGNDSSRRNDPWYLDPEPVLYPLKPYRFVYNVKGKNGQTEQYRREIGDGRFLSGSYGYILPDGIYRHVDYVADDRGFRAFIRTTEPGTANENPADVVINSNPVPVYPILGQNHFGTYSTALGAGFQAQTNNNNNSTLNSTNTTHLPLAIDEQLRSSYYPAGVANGLGDNNNLIAQFGSRTPRLEAVPPLPPQHALYPLPVDYLEARLRSSNGGRLNNTSTNTDQSLPSIIDNREYSPVISYNKRQGQQQDPVEDQFKSSQQQQHLQAGGKQTKDDSSRQQEFHLRGGRDRSMDDEQFNSNPYNSDNKISTGQWNNQIATNYSKQVDEDGRDNRDRVGTNSNNKLNYDQPIPPQRPPLTNNVRNKESNLPGLTYNNNHHDTSGKPADLPLERPPTISNARYDLSSETHHRSTDNDSQQQQQQLTEPFAKGIKGHSSGQGHLGGQHRSPTQNLFSGSASGSASGKTRARMIPPYQELSFMDIANNQKQGINNNNNNLQPPTALALPRFDDEQQQQQLYRQTPKSADNPNNKNTDTATADSGLTTTAASVLGTTTSPPIDYDNRANNPPAPAGPKAESKLIPASIPELRIPNTPLEPRAPIEPAAPREPEAPPGLAIDLNENKQKNDHNRESNTNFSATNRDKDQPSASSLEQNNNQEVAMDYRQNQPSSAVAVGGTKGGASKTITGQQQQQHRFGLTTRTSDGNSLSGLKNFRNTRMPENVMMNGDWRSLQNAIGLPQPPRNDAAGESLNSVTVLQDRDKLDRSRDIDNSIIASRGQETSLFPKLNELKSDNTRLANLKKANGNDEVAYFDALRLSSSASGKLIQSQADRLSELEKFRQRLRAQQLLLDQSRLGLPPLPTGSAASVAQPIGGFLTQVSSLRNNNNKPNNADATSSSGNESNNNQISARSIGSAGVRLQANEVNEKRSKFSSYLPNSYVSYDDENDTSEQDDDNNRKRQTINNSLSDYNERGALLNFEENRKRHGNSNNKIVDNLETLSRVDSSKSSQKLPTIVHQSQHELSRSSLEQNDSLEKEIERRFGDLAKKFQQNWPSIPSATQHLKAHLLATGGDNRLNEVPASVTVRSLVMRQQQLNSQNTAAPDKPMNSSQQYNSSEQQTKKPTSDALVAATHNDKSAQLKEQPRIRSATTNAEDDAKQTIKDNNTQFNMNLINSLTSLSASHMNPFVSPSASKLTSTATTTKTTTTKTTSSMSDDVGPFVNNNRLPPSIGGHFATSNARYSTPPELLAASPNYNTNIGGSGDKQQQQRMDNNNNLQFAALGLNNLDDRASLMARKGSSHNSLEDEINRSVVSGYANNHRLTSTTDDRPTSSVSGGPMAPMSPSSFENLALITSEGSQTFNNGRASMLNSLFSGQINHLKSSPISAQSVVISSTDKSMMSSNDKPDDTEGLASAKSKLLQHKTITNNQAKESTELSHQEPGGATGGLAQAGSSTTSNYRMPMPAATTPMAPMFSLTNSFTQFKPFLTVPLKQQQQQQHDDLMLTSQIFALGNNRASTSLLDGNNTNTFDDTTSRQREQGQVAKNHRLSADQYTAGGNSLHTQSFTSSVDGGISPPNKNHRFIEVISPVEETNFQAFKDAELSISAVSA